MLASSSLTCDLPSEGFDMEQWSYMAAQNILKACAKKFQLDRVREWTESNQQNLGQGKF